MVTWSVAIRTVIIDEYIRAAIERGCDTVVNLGAGLDARPYRLDLPSSLRWIEVDYAHMIEHKQQRLAGSTPRCALEQVKLDLTQRAERQALFADIGARSKSALVLTEGVLPYLAIEHVAELADDLHAHATIDHWIVDYFSPAVLRYRKRAHDQLANAPFVFAPADWFGFFAEHGWTREQIRYLPEVAAELGRPMPLPRPVRVIAKLLSLIGRNRIQAGVGYALLARSPRP
jgi:methyltransferase (TIGR00027 family)